MGVVRPSDRVRELTYPSYPSREWTLPPYRDGVHVLDVLMVGAGQAELVVASRLRIVDRNARGQEGPGTGSLVGAHHILLSTYSRER